MSQYELPGTYVPGTKELARTNGSCVGTGMTPRCDDLPRYFVRKFSTNHYQFGEKVSFDR
jgi:hypothetical protein